MKALIVDLRDGYAAALKENGTIVKIPDLNYFPGQSVELTEPDFEQEKKTLHKTRRFPKLLQKICTVAASAVFLSGIAAATAYALPYGTVSVDGEPSIAYTINCFDYVLGVEALNEEGEAVLSEMNLNDLRNHKVDTAVSRTLEQMEKDGYFRESESEIGIAAETQNDNHSEVLREKLENIKNN